MDAHGNCLSCGKDVAADAPYGLCPECLNRSVIFSNWESGTRSNVALTADQNQVALQSGLFVGGGRFKLIRELGRGGMGVVWLAEDQRLRDGDASVRVALKFLAPEIGLNPEAMEMMQREVLHSRRLRHRNIISIYDWHADDAGLPFISMEYVDGRTLSQLRREMPNHAFDWKQLQPILSQVCEALNYAHVVEETVHRDLKPGNIMVDAQGVVKVADFGLAHRSSAGAESAVAGRGASGTLPYMSPQQLLGRPAQPTDDIYSLGATMYELLTGTPPFFQGNLVEQILNEAPQPVAQRLALIGLHNTVPPSAMERIHQCLDKDPDRRPFPPSEVLKLFWEPEEETAAASRGWIAPVLLVLLLVAGGWFGYRACRERDKTPNDGNKDNEPPALAKNDSSTSSFSPTVVTPAPVAPPVVRTGSLRLAVASKIRNATYYSVISNVASQEIVRNKANWVPAAGQTSSKEEELPVGTYDVTMECYSGRPADPPSVLSERVLIVENATKTAVFDFSYVGIMVQSEPPGALVSFTYNGQAIHETTREGLPLAFSSVTPGFRTFKFSCEGYHDLTTNIMVPGGLTTAYPIHVTLSRRMHPEKGKDWGFCSLRQPLEFRWAGSFWVGVNEITRGQFAEFAAETKYAATNGSVEVTAEGWKIRPAGSWNDPGFSQTDDHPVVAVSWDEAKAFCGWLTRRDQDRGRLPRELRYRLPNSAEFDRLTAQLKPLLGGGNFAGTEVLGRGWNEYWQTLRDDNDNPHRDPHERTAPVGKTPGCRDSRGICDLLGNVAEWGEEWYTATMNHAEVLGAIPMLNEDGGGRAFRVVRGGSWYTEQLRDLDPAIRWRFPPGERHDFVGFRLVLVEENNQPSGNP